MTSTETYTLYNSLTGKSQTYEMPKASKSKTFFVPLDEFEQKIVARCQSAKDPQPEE